MKEYVGFFKKYVHLIRICRFDKHILWDGQLPEIPFNELPDLPPTINLEAPVILKTALQANRYLAELKVIVKLFLTPLYC